MPAGQDSFDQEKTIKSKNYGKQSIYLQEKA